MLAAIAVVCAITSVFAGAKKEAGSLDCVNMCASGKFTCGWNSISSDSTEAVHVDPNQLEAEREYIDYHLDFTRAAYGLDDIDEREFDYDGEVTAQEVDLNAETIST